MAAGDYTGYADYLAGLLPGLCVQVARAWLAAEGGGPGENNPLNVTRTASGLDQGYTGGFADYPSVEVGLQAAAWLVINGLYAGIRAALPTHSPQIQRLAIINSPWAGGHYNHGASFPSVSGPCQAPSGATSGIPNAQPASYTSPTGAGITEVVATGGPACAGVAPVQPQSGLLPIPGKGGIFPIPKDRISDPCACPSGYNRVKYDPQVEGLLGTNYVPLDQLGPDDANACAPVGLGPGSVLGQQLTTITIAGIQGLVVNGALIFLIALLGYRGLTQLLS